MNKLKVVSTLVNILPESAVPVLWSEPRPGRRDLPQPRVSAVSLRGPGRAPNSPSFCPSLSARWPPGRSRKAQSASPATNWIRHFIGGFLKYKFEMILQVLSE